MRLDELWYGRSPLSILLAPLGWLYGAMMGLRRALYRIGILRSTRVAVPVIVVGNLTVGGTGKTPLVIWLARQLTARGLKVGIVSRGYGSRGGETPRLVGAETSWQEVGDEPLLVSRRSGCLTIVSRDRVAAAIALVERCGVVFFADDGLLLLR